VDKTPITSKRGNFMTNSFNDIWKEIISHCEGKTYNNATGCTETFHERGRLFIHMIDPRKAAVVATQQKKVEYRTPTKKIKRTSFFQLWRVTSWRDNFKVKAAITINRSVERKHRTIRGGKKVT
jgi:hypothetical protein